MRPGDDLPCIFCIHHMRDHDAACPGIQCPLDILDRSGGHPDQRLDPAGVGGPKLVFQRFGPGGAVLLGVRGLAVIGHGNSSAEGVANAVRVAARGIRGRLVEQFGTALASEGAERPSAA